ncbi:MAG: DUF624 domain-containing protein [Blautia sp.]|nr:DUF624 domain-containing protein [Blautia sp.]
MGQKDVLNNRFWNLIGSFCDFCALNFIFLITCLPVVTIGAAVTALSSVTMREARGSTGI